MFVLRVKTDNAAFDDGAGGRRELARILRTLAVSLEVDQRSSAPVLDHNGNTVGTWAVRG